METIRKGWNHTWNNRFLWALGFLAALGSGSSFSNSNYSFNNGDPAALEAWMTPGRMAALSAGIVAFSIVALLLGIFIWLLALSARGGMIGSVAQLELGTGKPSFREALHMGWARLGRLVGMTILLYIVPFILFIVLVVGFIGTIGGLAFIGAGMEDPGAIAAGAGGLVLVFLCLMCLMIPVMLVLSLIYPFAFRGIMLRSLGARESLRHGWAVLRANLGEIIILGLIFFAINLAVGFLLLIVLIPVGLLVGVPFIALMESNATFLQGILAALGILVALVISALVTAYFAAWQSSTFTVAYLEWTGKDVSVKG